MLEMNTDCAGYPVLNASADFVRYCIQSKTIEEFTANCGTELQVALLGLIVKAEDEYVRIIQTKSKRKMTKDERLTIGEFLMDYVDKIDNELVRKFRKEVMEHDD